MSTHWIGLERAEVYQGTLSVELLFIALLCVRWILKWLSEWSIQMWLKIIERFWCLWNIGFIHLLFPNVFWFGVQIHLLLVDLLYDVPLLNLGHFSIWIFIWIFWCHIVFELLILYFWCAKESHVLFFQFLSFFMIRGVLDWHEKAIWSLHPRVNLIWELQGWALFVDTLNLVAIALYSKSLAFIWGRQVFLFHTWILLLANRVAVKSIGPKPFFHWWAAATLGLQICWKLIQDWLNTVVMPI